MFSQTLDFLILCWIYSSVGKVFSMFVFTKLLRTLRDRYPVGYGIVLLQFSLCIALEFA